MFVCLLVCCSLAFEQTCYLSEHQSADSGSVLRDNCWKFPGEHELLGIELESAKCKASAFTVLNVFFIFGGMCSGTLPGWTSGTMWGAGD